MKLASVKTGMRKVLALGLVAGAVALVAPAKAEAQQFAIGFQYGPSYHEVERRDFRDRFRYEREREAIARHEAWERQRAWEQHERWEHARDRDRSYGSRGYVAPYGYEGQQRGYYGR